VSGDNSQSSNGRSDDRRDDQFVRLLLTNERCIYTFILTLVHNRSDAEDIMQDTASLMWRKYRELDSVSNFAAWGVRIAHYKVLEFRKKRYKDRIQFSNKLFEEIVGGAATVSDDLGPRLDALKKCLARLGRRDRKLVMMRHEQNSTTRTVARSIGMSVESAYKTIPRLHDMLLRCIRRKLNTDGVA